MHAPFVRPFLPGRAVTPSRLLTHPLAPSLLTYRYTDKGQLLEPRQPVLYECNDLCRCHHEGCKNRVLGKGLQLRLEVFKCVYACMLGPWTSRQTTSSSPLLSASRVRCKEPGKGWGIRCLDRIPAGTYITDYLGEIMTEEDAEKRGLRCA